MRKIQYTVQRAVGARRQYVRPEVEVLDVGESGPLMTSGGGNTNNGDSNQASGNVYNGNSDDLVSGGGFGYGGEEDGDDIIAE